MARLAFVVAGDPRLSLRGGDIPPPLTRPEAPTVSSTPAGQRDYSGIRLTYHARERFIERFGVAPKAAESALRQALARCRRLGRNPDNGAIAVLALHGDRMLIAILQDATCVTVLTWNQFEPKMADFGRTHLPRKRGRMLQRLREGPE